MRIVYWCIYLFLLSGLGVAQEPLKNLQNAIIKFESDSQMRHAMYSLYVVDGKTGKVVYDKHSQIGLAPASTQKLLTSGAAFELLGNNFRYKTDIGYRGSIANGILKADLLIIESGDPTLGSWRFEKTREDSLLRFWVDKIKSQKIKQINHGIWIYHNGWSNQTIPDGWIWQDIGNYYGAGAGGINWRENQYDLVLKSGVNVGDPVEIVNAKPGLVNVTLTSEVVTAAKGSGDNAYIYLAPYGDYGVVRGTIPADEKNFTISGSFPNPGIQLISTLKRELEKNEIKVLAEIDTAEIRQYVGKPNIFASVYSPPLDSINYWFLRRSVNLYGEALVKTISHIKTGIGSTEKGIELVKDFWVEKGIDRSAINIMDGSGLSPQNRITTNALVRVLQYAKTRPWYNSFYTSLPTYNGMKMKSGSIGGARSFAGYHTSKNGNEYIFAIIVNNYDGSSTAMVRKMYQVLDILK
jgi:serine-type D-Ala-D-Ala carboxypeptidase/endopeptidase (penicillin-binding protein 4)